MMAVHKRGKSYVIDYYVDGRRIRETIGPNKQLAQTVLRKREVQVAENRFLDVRRFPKIRFEDMSREYLEVHSKTNKRSYVRDVAIVKHLDEFFAGKNLDEISPADVEKYKRHRLAKVSKSTVNRELACFKHIFKKANEWGKTDRDPTRAVRLLKTPPPRIRYLEVEEINALYSACSPFLKPIILVAVNTGMRKGELLNLKWSDLDFEKRLIYLSDTKGAARREVPMNDIVHDTVLTIQRNPHSIYVFCHQNGQPYRDIRASLDKAATEGRIEGLRFHDLRHTFASQLVMSGVDLKTVQELLGHRTIEMTLRYSHLSPDHKRAAMDVLAKRMDTFWTHRDQVGEAHQSRVRKSLPIA